MRLLCSLLSFPPFPFSLPLYPSLASRPRAHQVSKVVHLESVAKGVRVLVVLVDVSIVGHPGNVLSQLLQIILRSEEKTF